MQHSRWSASTKSTIRRGVAIAVTGLTFYVVLPELLRVLAAWPRLASLVPAWLSLMVVAEIGSFACSLALQRLILRSRQWFPVVTSSLAGNAVTNVVPAGDAVGASVQYRMLVTAGVDSVQAASGLAVSSLLNVAALFALPVFVVPAIVGGLTVNRGLLLAAVLGIGGFVLLVAAGVAAFRFDGVLRQVARLVQGISNLVHRQRHRASTALARRLLEQRDLVGQDLGRNWQRAILLISGRIGLDYLSLLSALRATGTRPSPALVLLAYAATTVVGLLPLTPGGLGLIEATLSGLLVLAGVKGASAVLAVLAYRVGCYWLPILAGGVSYVMFRRRYGTVEATPPST